MKKSECKMKKIIVIIITILLQKINKIKWEAKTKTKWIFQIMRNKVKSIQSKYYFCFQE